MASRGVKLRELANILKTPYEEIHVTLHGKSVYDNEYDGWQAQCLAEDDVVLEYDFCYVKEVDCYYDGDHMILEIDLGSL